MQIVIDLPKEIYEFLQNNDTGSVVDNAIKNGIPLSEHCRLIDANKAFDVMMEHIEDFPDVGAETYLVDDFAFEQWLQDVPTVIEATE